MHSYANTYTHVHILMCTQWVQLLSVSSSALLESTGHFAGLLTSCTTQGPSSPLFLTLPPTHTVQSRPRPPPAAPWTKSRGARGWEEPPEGESEAAAQGWGAGPGGQDKTGAEDEDARAAAGHFLGGSWRCSPELTGNAGGNAPNSTAGWQWGGRTKEGPPGFRRHHLGDPIQQVRLS